MLKLIQITKLNEERRAFQRKGPLMATDLVMLVLTCGTENLPV